jgi:hypothetical protein
MSIITNTQRLGNFTSSNIYKLLSKAKNGKDFGAPALSYIEELNIEREMGIHLGNETSARPLDWGKHCEQFAFDHISTEYIITSDITTAHPTLPFWVGSADGYKEDTVFDLKCPMTRKSFFGLVAGDNIRSMIDGFTRNEFKYKAHTDAEKYYWQLVSNAIILGKKYAELIVYMPYQSELLTIKEAAKDFYNWIHYSADIELPYLPDGGKFQNINIIRFEVPQSDIDLLTECVTEASKYLITP